MSVIEWFPSPGNLTNNELVVCPFMTALFIILFYIIQLTVSNQLDVLYSFWFQGTKNNFRLLFLHKTLQKSSNIVISDHIFLHTLQNENIGATNWTNIEEELYIRRTNFRTNFSYHEKIGFFNVAEFLLNNFNCINHHWKICISNYVYKPP